MDNPPAWVRDRHLAFIQANWPVIAAESYRGFKRRGRGMIFLQEVDFIGEPVEHPVKFKLAYVAEGSREFMVMGGRWPGAKEYGWIRSYAPELTCLVAISREDGGISSYEVTGLANGTPLLCYEQSIGKIN